MADGIEIYDEYRSEKDLKFIMGDDHKEMLIMDLTGLIEGAKSYLEDDDIVHVCIDDYK